MVNVVEVLITGKNLTGPALAEAEGGALSFSKVMNKVGIIGIAAVAGITVESAKMATTFDSAMTMINTQAGVSKNQIGALSKGVLDLAGKVGYDPTSLADALYHIESSFASVGIKGPTALNLLKIAAEGAQVGHANLVDVTNALDAVIASGIGGVKNYSQAMGVLNATVGAGDMKMQDLAEAFGTGILAAVKGFGLSIKDVGAALAVFGDNNIRGAKAGTDLRMAVQALAAPTKAGDALFKSWGMTQNQLADDMRTKGLLFTLQDLTTEFRKNGVSAQEQGQIITEAFGKKAGVGLMVLMSQMDRLASKYPDMQKGADKFGQAWQTTSETAAQKLHDLQGSFDALMVEVGNKVLPVVMTFLNFLQSHFTLIASLVGIFLSLAAALKIVAIAQGLVDAAMEANPFIFIAAAVIALAVVIIKYHKQIWDFVTRIWSDITKFVEGVWNDFLNFAKAWWPLLLGPAGLIIKYHNDIWNFIVRIWTDVVSFVKRIWNDIYSAISGTITNILNMVSGWVNNVVNFITSIPGKIGNLGSRIFHAIVDGIGDIGGWIMSHVVDPIVNFITSIPSRIGNIGSRILGDITGGLGNAASSVMHFLGLAQGGVMGAAVGGVQGGMRMVGEYGPELVRLPAGSTVSSASDTPGMLAGLGGAVQVVLSLDPSFHRAGIDPSLLQAIRYEVRTKGGGSVQKAFGRN